MSDIRLERQEFEAIETRAIGFISNRAIQTTDSNDLQHV